MGQLNNLYVSSSYQGLLKMTDSTNGLTNTLQTIQTGDGDNSPLQMSLTEVNISGSFTVNGSPITGSTSGTSGTSGISGTSGTSGIGFVLAGDWTGTTTYSINEVVVYNGTSYAALQSSLNKIPPVQPAYWQVVSAAGTSGSSGTSGIGTNGTSGTSGSNGTDGTSGSNGTDGSSGSDGTSGSNGTDGTSGSNGTDGSSGTSGSDGSSGTSGSSGSNGTDGSSGTSGSSGSDGSSGTSGSSGSDGSSGTSGSNGSDGSSGTSGAVNYTGLITTGSVGLIQPITGSLNLTSITTLGTGTTPSTPNSSTGTLLIFSGDDINGAANPNIYNIANDNGVGWVMSGPGITDGTVTSAGYGDNTVEVNITSGNVVSGSSYTGTGPYYPYLNITGSVYSSNGFTSPAGFIVQNQNGTGNPYGGMGIQVDTTTDPTNVFSTVFVNGASSETSFQLGLSSYTPMYSNETVPVIYAGGYYNAGLGYGSTDTTMTFYSSSIQMWKPTSFKAPVAITGSLRINGSTIITGSLNVSAGITGSLQGTSSFATNFNKTGLITTGSIGGSQTIKGSLTTTDDIVFSGSNYQSQGRFQIVNNQTLQITNNGIGSGYSQSGSAIQMTFNTGSGGLASFQMNASVSGSISDLSILNTAGTTKVRGLAQQFLFSKTEGFPNTAANSFEVDATNIILSGSTNITGSLSINSGSLNVPSRINFTTGFVPTYIEALGDTFDIYTKNFGLTTDTLIISTSPSAPQVTTQVSSSAFNDGIFNSHIAKYNDQIIGFAWSTYNSIPENSLSANFYGPGTGNHESPYGGNDDVIFQITTGSNVVDWYRDMNFSGSLNMSGSLTVTGSLSVGGNLQFNVGAFQSTQTQSGSANVSQSITYDTTDYSQGVTYVSGSRLTVANKGVYNIQFSAQIDRVAGSGTDTVHIWLKKNGTNLAGSAGSITISGGASAAKTISSWNYVVDSAANDYYELVWQPTDSNIQLIAAGATGNIPSIPSIITTVTQVR